jgi:uncharacterized protein (TIGR01777 family)
MKIAVTGASGVVGRALTQVLKDEGHEVYSMVRRPAASPSEMTWDPSTGHVDAGRMSKMDAVVHLAGESIANKRWNDDQKRVIRESRVDATYKLASTLSAINPRPRVLVAASAIGFYGDRGEQILSETSSMGEGFLAKLCKGWEDSTLPAQASDVRVVHARISMVLSKNGGALSKLLPIFQTGLGGPIGSGTQYMSWIDETDLARAILYCIQNEDISGPVNMAAPNPVTNKEFTKVLAHVLGKPAFLPVPPAALKVAMGELADELLLCSQKVMPTVLQSAGFRFEYADLERALRHVLAQ